MKKLILCILILLFTAVNAFGEVYPIKSVTKIQDGDSFSCLIEFTPFKIQLEIDIRVDGINTPELKSHDPREKELAIRARDYTKNFLMRDHLFVDVKKKEKYGRFLCNVFSNEVDLGKSLIAANLAREYHGEKRPKNWFDDTPKTPSKFESLKKGLESLR